MKHRELVKEVCTCIIDALGLQVEPINLAAVVEASIKEKNKLGRYGSKQNDVEYLFERLKRED